MKQVVIIVPERRTNLSSITGAYEILSLANKYWQKPGNIPIMRIHIAGFMKELKLDEGVFSVHPVNISRLLPTDLLIIPSVDYVNDLFTSNTTLTSWIKEQYKSGSDIATMCSGAFLLAAAGLLEGKTCSTHWNVAAQLKRLIPNVHLLPDKLIIAEKGIYTNGGAYSFLNLMLILVEKYFDRVTAIYCSKIFQIDMDRTSQSPFFIFQTQKNHGDEMFCEAQTYIEENLSSRISFKEHGAKLATSRRNFDRRFIKATGNTPVEYWQRIKVEVAKKHSRNAGKASLK
ncbi:MAG: DJ-1/PfpI family protein [Ferruginibacter sp.]